MEKIIENTKTIKDLFAFNPLVCNRFVIRLPEELDIPEFYIQGFDINTESKIISISIMETEEKNIRDNFEEVSKINNLIKDRKIEIEYLDPTGVSIRKERYTNIEYIGERYCGANYEEMAKVITTTLVFTFDKRENATAN